MFQNYGANSEMFIFPYNSTLLMWWSDKFEYSVGRVSDVRFWGSRLEFWSGSSLFFSSSYTSLIITVYIIIFAPVLFSPLLANLEFAQKKLCLKRDNMRHCNSSSLKFARWQRGKRGKNEISYLIFSKIITSETLL